LQNGKGKRRSRRSREGKGRGKKRREGKWGEERGKKE